MLNSTHAQGKHWENNTDLTYYWDWCLSAIMCLPNWGHPTWNPSEHHSALSYLGGLSWCIKLGPRLCPQFLEQPMWVFRVWELSEISRQTRPVLCSHCSPRKLTHLRMDIGTRIASYPCQNSRRKDVNSRRYQSIVWTKICRFFGQRIFSACWFLSEAASYY